MRIESVITNDNFIMKKFAKYVLVSVFAFAFLANQAYAITVSQLMAAGFTQSQAELVIALLGGSDDNSGSCYTHTVTLRVGSTGSQVMAMQKVVGTTADGVFGPATKAAVMAWQSNNGLVADGIVGPNTGAAMSGNCDDDNGDDSDPYDSSDLDGSFGIIENVTELSQYNNEDVGEGEDDVIILGFEVEASNDGDIQISSMKISFDPAGNASGDSDNLDDYITDVSIWMGDDKVGEVDVEDFSVNSSDVHSKTVVLDNSIVRADDKEKFYVAVSAQNSLDSGDIDSDSWSVDVDNIRFVDGSGVVTTDSSTGDINAMNQAFDFASFATAADVEMKVNLADDNPDSMVVDVDDTSDTDGVELLVFTIEAQGSDIVIEDLPVLLTVTGATDVDAVANTLYLEADGNSWSETISTTTAAATITFDNIDFEISEGDEVEFTVLADINDIETGFDEGDTLKAELRSFEVDAIDAEDEQGDTISDADATGTALGDPMAFYDTGIMVEFIDSSVTNYVDDGADDDTGEFVIEFKVTAFGGTVYVSDTATATTASTIAEATLSSVGNLYRVTDSGTATTDDLAYDVSYTTGGGASNSSNGNIELADGEYTTVSLTVTQTNDSIEDDGIYRMYLQAILWNSDDSSSTFNVYDFDLEDYKTNALSLN